METRILCLTCNMLHDQAECRLNAGFIQLELGTCHSGHGLLYFFADPVPVIRGCTRSEAATFSAFSFITRRAACIQDKECSQCTAELE